MTSDPVALAIQRGRHRKHMTQKELAQALGVSRETVARWETGAFPGQNAGAIEELLDITIPPRGERASVTNEVPA